MRAGMTVRLSILLPTYNGDRFLEAQLSSILAQTDADLELLAVDDGSTDASAALLASHARRDGRLRVLSGTSNQGQSIRLRQLLAEARGEFVAIADQDDVWAADRNEKLLAAIGDRPLAFGRSDLIDARGASLGDTLLGSLGVAPDPDARLQSLFRAMVSAHAAIIRREWIDAAALSYPLPFDWLLGTAALHGGGLAYVPDAIVGHRMHDTNQMNRAAPDGTRRLARLRNHYAFLLRRPLQLRFWLMLDFLGRSLMVTPEVRRTLAPLAAACRDTWFSGTPRPRASDQALRGRLRADLQPLAGSIEDWAAASRQIDLATHSIVHPWKLREGVRRLRSSAAEY